MFKCWEKEKEAQEEKAPDEVSKLSLKEQVIYHLKKDDWEFPELKPIVLAQFYYETGRFNEEEFLAPNHYNFGGLKWREEMAPLASPVKYTSSSDNEYLDYCSFKSIDDGLDGYWKFINRSVYDGWREFGKDPIGFMKFINHKGYHPAKDYYLTVEKLLDEATKDLGLEPAPKPQVDKPDKPVLAKISDGQLRLMHPEASFLPEYGLLLTKGYLPRNVVGKDSSGKLIYELDWKNILLLVHHTAGHQNAKARDFFSYMRKQGYCTDFLDHTGQIWQQRHGDRRGSNAGESKYKGKSNVSTFSIALEIAGGGKLKLKRADGVKVSWSKNYIPSGTKLVTWFGKNPVKARYVTREMGYAETGWYEAFTEAQEKSLAVWLIGWASMGIPLEQIVGHDEVAGKKYLGRQRKNDPGGSLSMPLGKFVDKFVRPVFD